MEKTIKSDRVNAAGYICYVLRNQWMIDDSDFAIFHIIHDNTKSGTNYAKSMLLELKRFAMIFNLACLIAV